MTIAPGRPPRRTLVIALLVGLGVLVAGAIVALVLMLALGGTPPTPMVTVPETVSPTITPSPTGVPAPPED